MDPVRLTWAGRRWDDRLVSPLSVRDPREQPDVEFVERWRHAVDPENSGQFERRLSFVRLADAGAPLLFADTGPSAPPDWLSRLRTLQQVLVTSGYPDERNLDIESSTQWARRNFGGSDVAYSDLLWPLADWAWTQVDAELVDAGITICSPDAAQELTAGLVERLSAVLAPSLLAFRPLRPADDAEPSAVADYLQACRELAADGLAGFFAAFPVAGRLSVQTVDQWRTVVRELLTRIHGDAVQLADEFGVRSPLRVISAVLGAGDSHAGGRTATVLAFEGEHDSVRLVYKPHDMRLEAAYARISQQFLGLSAEQMPSRILPIGRDYGYARFVEHRPARDAAEVTEFYRRAGAMLALQRVLQVTDVHQQNVVACGPDLVVIDPETMLSPRLVGGPDPQSGAMHSLARSVLPLLVLPRWMSDARTGGAFDVSALGCESPPPARIVPFVNVNTDRMRFRPSEPGVGELLHLPAALAPTHPLVDHVGELLEGFTIGYRRLMSSTVREWLAREIIACAGLNVRIVLRSTRLYAGVLESALTPDALADPRERALTIEVLARGAMESQVMAASVLGHEIAAIESGDVPMFSHELGTDALSINGVDIPAEIASHGIARSLELLDSLDESDLRWQLDLITTAIDLRWPRSTPRIASPTGAEPASLALVDRLWESSWAPEPGSLDWATVRPVTIMHHAGIRPIDIGGYSGLAGLTAALSVVVADIDADIEPVRHERGQLQLARARQALAGAIDSTVRGDRTGERRATGTGLAGVGGVLRLFTSPAGGSLDQRGPRIRQLASLLDGRPWAWGDARDLMRGPAACIAPLIAASDEVEQVMDVRSLVSDLADRLVSYEMPTGGWFDPIAGRPLWGMLYGASGIGLALARAGVFTGREELVDAAARAFAFERGVGRAGNWSNAFGPSASAPNAHAPSTWCSGAAGIALARAAALSVVPDHPEAHLWREDLDLAFEATWQAEFAAGPLRPSDHLCCGTMGVAASFVCAAAFIREPTLLRRGRDIIDLVVAERGSASALRPGWTWPEYAVGSASLFTGAAGIAMVLAGEPGWTSLSAFMC